MDSVENTLKKAILQESIKIPNLQNLNDAKRKDKMIEMLKKASKENQIPFLAIEEVFKDSHKATYLLSLLGIGKSNKQSQEVENVQSTIKSRR